MRLGGVANECHDVVSVLGNCDGGGHDTIDPGAFGVSRPDTIIGD